MQSVHENIKSVRGQLKKVYKTLNTLENWRKAILLVCVVALGVDPLFLFIPVIDSPNFCFTFDKKLAAVVSAIRTFIDTFYVIHIIFNFITEYILVKRISAAPQNYIAFFQTICLPVNVLLLCFFYYVT